MKSEELLVNRPIELRGEGLCDAAPSTSRRELLRRLGAQRRQQGERIKQRLAKSPGGVTLCELLSEMEQTHGVWANLYSLENPAWRLVWQVTVDYEAPGSYRYIVVRRLFAGQALDPFGTHCLGPAWEAPLTWLQYTEEELERLLSQEEIEVRSAAGTRRIRVGAPGWVERLREALQEAYQAPFHHSPQDEAILSD